MTNDLKGKVDRLRQRVEAARGKRRTAPRSKTGLLRAYRDGVEKATSIGEAFGKELAKIN